MAGPSDDSALASSLTALTTRLGFARVTALQHLSGGASKETWSFAAGDTHLVLRRQAPLGTGAGADEAATSSALAIGLDDEAALMILAGRYGVPSPEVLYVLSPSDGLGAGFVMRHVNGETLGGRIVRAPTFENARANLAVQCGEVLARIHAIPLAECPPLRVKSAQTILDELWTVHLAEGRPRPVFDLAFAWLRQRAPRVAEPTLVHGDFRNGNLIVDHNGLAAVLDWELAQSGDPMQDLGWLCVNSWRFGVIDKPVGGFGTFEDLCRGYESAGGKRVDPKRVRYWQILGSLRWGVMTTMSTTRFYAGGGVSVDLPMIARRASETELDLIDLLEAAQ